MLHLLQTVAQWHNFQASKDDTIYHFKFLEDNEDFMKAYAAASSDGPDIGLEVLNSFKSSIFKACKENKELTKVLAKEGFRQITLRTAAKSLANLASNPVAITSDLTQAAFEYAGFEKEGKVIGMLGNMGTHAFIGFTTVGPLGVPAGMLAGFGTWQFGEIVGGTLDQL